MRAAIGASGNRGVRLIGRRDYKANRAALTRISTRLTKWNTGGQHDEALARLREQVAPVCARLPANDADRKACDALFVRGPDKA